MNPAGKVRCNMRKQIELGRDDCNSAEPGDKCGVDQFAMTGRPAVEHDRRPKSRSVAPHTGGARTKRRARRSTKVGGLVWETPAWPRRGGGEVAGFGVCGVDQNPISARCGGHRVGGLVPSAPALSEVMAPRRVSGRVFNSPQRSENYWTRVRYSAEVVCGCGGHSRRQLLANSAIAASRVAAYPVRRRAVLMIPKGERPFPMRI